MTIVNQGKFEDLFTEIPVEAVEINRGSYTDGCVALSYQVPGANVIYEMHQTKTYVVIS